MILSPLLIGDGLLSKWIEFTSVHEAPKSMHFTSFLTMFSAVVERRLVIHRGYRIRAGVYTLLIGPSATRKNLPITLAKEVYEDAGLRVHWFGTNVTEEGVATAFDGMRAGAESTFGMFSATEFGRILGGKRYQDGMLRLLIDAYDGSPLWHDRRGEKGDKKGEERTGVRYGCPNPYIVLLAASTPGDLRSLPDETLKTGLTSRFWIIGEKGKEKWNPEPEFDEDLQKEIIEELRERIELIYEKSTFIMRMGSAARKVFDPWYMKGCKEFELKATSEMEAWSGKRHDHAVRAASLIQLIDGGDSHEISAESLKRGIEFIEAMEPGMSEAYGIVGETSWSLRKREIKEMVGKNGGIEMRHLKGGLGRKWGKGEGEMLIKEMMLDGEIGWEPGATGKIMVKG